MSRGEFVKVSVKEKEIYQITLTEKIASFWLNHKYCVGFKTKQEDRNPFDENKILYLNYITLTSRDTFPLHHLEYHGESQSL